MAAPVAVSVCIPDEQRRSTNQYHERLYKEVNEFRKLEKEIDQIQAKRVEGGRKPTIGDRLEDRLRAGL